MMSRNDIYRCCVVLSSSRQTSVLVTTSSFVKVHDIFNFLRRIHTFSVPNAEQGCFSRLKFQLHKAVLMKIKIVVGKNESILLKVFRAIAVLRFTSTSRSSCSNDAEVLMFPTPLFFLYKKLSLNVIDY